MTKRVRLYCTMHKKDGMSQEEFYRYWHDVHGQLFASLDIVKKNLLKYEQVRFTFPSWNALVNSY
jgi:hypothetical protein